jgi:hypothetical protein
MLTATEMLIEMIMSFSRIDLFKTSFLMTQAMLYGSEVYSLSSSIL